MNDSLRQQNQPAMLMAGSMAMQSLVQWLMQRLAIIGNVRERRAIVDRLIHYYLQIDSLDYITNVTVLMDDELVDLLSRAVERLAAHEPIQYILEEAYFLDLRLKVTPDVLIPRSETEEWVHFLMHHLSEPSRILDIGTGSGCLAIALKQRFPNALVTAIDVSKQALLIAQENARQSETSIHFIEQDILTQSLGDQQWSLIVSNPPYIPCKEQYDLPPEVRCYEPLLALLVPEPLLFYRRIAALARKNLSAHGRLCLEIHAHFSQEVCTLLQAAHFRDIALHHDLHGKARWVMATAPYSI